MSHDGDVGDPTITPKELQAELERVRVALKKVNAESAGRRKELDALEKEKADKDKAALSETEKLQAEVKAARDEHKELEDQLRVERVRTAVIKNATELGFANPEDALALTDLSEVDTTDGKVTGFEKSLKALAESGRLTMKTEDQRQSDGLGTPPGRGKPTKQTKEQAVPVVRL